jgi:hypothetical protein
MGGRNSHGQWHDLTSYIGDSLQHESRNNYPNSKQLVLVPMMVDTHRPNKRPCPWDTHIGEAQQLLQLDPSNTELREEVKRIKLQLAEVLDHLNELKPKTTNTESNKGEEPK